MINRCWFCFKWGAAALIVAAVGGFLYIRYTVDDEIRRHVEQLIAAHYTDLDVSLRSAELVKGEGIVVRGLSLVERGAEGPQSELAYFEEIFFASRTDLEDLLTGRIGVTHITVRRPVFRATRRLDGCWSLEKLLPLPDFGEEQAEAAIENATIEIFDPSRENASTFLLRDINVAVTPTRRQLPDGSTEVVPEFEGSLSADYVQRIEFRGWHDPRVNRFSLGGRVQNLTVSPDLRDALPSDLARRLRGLGSLRGQVDFDFRVGHEPAAAQPWQFVIAGQMLRGRVDDPRLPYPITDIQTSFTAEATGLAIEGLTARSGRTTLRMNVSTQGYDESSPKIVEVETQRLVLDRQLADVLPPDLQQTWYKFLPAGEVNAAAKLSFDGQRWRSELLVDCIDVSFSHHQFPYRLERGTGTIEAADGRVRVQMTAFADTRAVAFEANMQGEGEEAVGHVTVRAERLPLNEKLFEALPSHSQRIVRDFNPRGTFDAYLHLHRDRPHEPIHRRMVIRLNGVAVEYEHFPYPIQSITGTIDNYDDRWSFLNLQGVNNTGVIACEGHSEPTQDGHELRLRFTGAGVPLEQELRDALPAETQAAWNLLRPSGALDFASEIHFLSATNQLSVDLALDLDGESVSIEPTVFPYRLEYLRGKVRYRDGLVEFHGLKALHDRTMVTSDGQCAFHPNGGWDFRVSNLHVDRLRADRDLIAALPRGMSRALNKLDLDGPVNLSGSFAIAHSGREGDATTARWDVRMNTMQGRMQPGLELRDINGEIRLSGGWDGRNLATRGWLELDSISFKDLHFTQVRGPLWITNQEVLFGAWATTPVAGEAAPRITAASYGGEVAADGRIVLDDIPRYALQASVSNGDLQQFAKESGAGGSELRGRVFGTIQLQGAGKGTHSLTGAGSVRLRDATIYELPLMVSLLKILSVRTPDSNAFSTSDMNFRIAGEHVYFDQMNFYGDAVSLLGKGEVGLDKNMKMVFHAVVGNNESQLPVLRPLLGLAGQQLLLIYVDGPLNNPRTTKEALPGVRRAVEDLQGVPPAAVGSPSLLRQAERGIKGIFQ